MDETILSIVEIPEQEKAEYSNSIKSYRKQHIRPVDQIVDEVFSETPELNEMLKEKRASEAILMAREKVWKKFLIEESGFNAAFLSNLSNMLETPKMILEQLIKARVAEKTGDELNKAIRSVCGEYAGRVAPYVYQLSLSNTQSRRSRSGKTFEAIVYKIYSSLRYPFDSQSKVGREMFSNAGLGKKVDSVLPSIEAYLQLRGKTIIGTMKTSLRERWQEVAEELTRTGAPQIWLLTVDEDIAMSKIEEMNKHNIVLVVPKSVKDTKKLNSLRNVISFEDYFFSEIPSILSYWRP